MDDKTKANIKKALLGAGCPEESVDHFCSYDPVDVYVALYKVKHTIVIYKEKYAYHRITNILKDIKLKLHSWDQLVEKFK